MPNSVPKSRIPPVAAMASPPTGNKCCPSSKSKGDKCCPNSKSKGDRGFLEGCLFALCCCWLCEAC